MEHFFPRIQVQTGAQMHTRVKLLEGMQKKTILKLLGVYSQIIGGKYPPIHPASDIILEKMKLLLETLL